MTGGRALGTQGMAARDSGKRCVCGQKIGGQTHRARSLCLHCHVHAPQTSRADPVPTRRLVTISTDAAYYNTMTTNSSFIAC